MLIHVTKDNVVIDKDSYNTHKGEYNVTTCEFTFSDEFKDVAKMANFTIQSTKEFYNIDIVENKCMIPGEIFEKEFQKIELGVYGFVAKEDGTLEKRYSPCPDEFVVHCGSYKEGGKTPEIMSVSQYELYAHAIQEGLRKISECGEYATEQGDYAKEQGNFAKEQGEFAKAQGEVANEIAGEILERAEGGDFDGADFNYDWQGTALGVKNSKETDYTYVDLKGEKGDVGDFYFATFEIDIEKGELIAHKTKELELIRFELVNEYLEVII